MEGQSGMKKLFVVLSMLFLLAAGTVFAAAERPKTVLHVITVKFKDGTTQAQINKAVDAAAQIPGVLRVWARPIKMQLPEGFKHIIVMEFKDEATLKAYADSPAQKKFYDVYLPLRDESRTHDITN